MNGPSLLVPLRLVPVVKKSLYAVPRLVTRSGVLLTRPYESQIAPRQRYSTVTLQRTFSGIWPAEATDASITGGQDQRPRNTGGGGLPGRRSLTDNDGHQRQRMARND